MDQSRQACTQGQSSAVVEVGDFSQAVAVDAVDAVVVDAVDAVAVDVVAVDAVAVDADYECDEVAVVFSAVAVVSDD